MRPSLYDEVHQLAVDVVNASESGDFRSEWHALELLRDLCEENAENDKNHPLQWETLADFTSDKQIALSYYEKALARANELRLDDYSASALFEIAKLHLELGNISLALEFGHRANTKAKSIEDLELRKEISELFLDAHNIY